MLRPQAEQLIDRARAGERLNSTDRRHCVGYIKVIHPEMSNVDMAEIFGVHESLIRVDLKKIREEKAKLIKEDDIGLVIADIALTFERQVIDIERSKNKCALGSRAYLEHCRTIARMQVDRVKLLQELGYYPRQLGNLTVSKFEYQSIVSKDGSVDTRRVDMQNVIDVEVVEAEPLALPSPETISEFEQQN